MKGSYFQTKLFIVNALYIIGILGTEPPKCSPTIWFMLIYKQSKRYCWSKRFFSGWPTHFERQGLWAANLMGRIHVTVIKRITNRFTLRLRTLCLVVLSLYPMKCVVDGLLSRDTLHKPYLHLRFKTLYKRINTSIIKLILFQLLLLSDIHPFWWPVNCCWLIFFNSYH